MYGRLFFAAKAKRYGLIDSVRQGLSLTLDETILMQKLMQACDDEQIAIVGNGVAQALSSRTPAEGGDDFDGTPPV